MSLVSGVLQAFTAPVWTLARISIAAGAKGTHGQLCLDNLRLTTSVEAQEVEPLRKLCPDLEVLGIGVEGK